ncbi:hypothetical protein KCP78_18965 [Salmonella enterica subsp. enterica]|nr:hypothetical protein KCP78_18965 [Salmonella enterica subsp. enterica]
MYYWFCRLRLGYTFSRDAVTTGGDRGICRALLGNMQTAMIIGAGMQLVCGRHNAGRQLVPSDAGGLYLILSR